MFKPKNWKVVGGDAELEAEIDWIKALNIREYFSKNKKKDLFMQGFLKLIHNLL